MSINSFLLYGANGYTGALIARYATDYGLIPVLAGRREEALKPLAEELRLSYIVIDLDNTTALQHALQNVAVVVHAAGPFADTAKQMIEACLQTGTHYIDINGDISVFEFIKSFDARAKEKNILLLPGAGFDVVPTDCMALYLKSKLPDATQLQIAFASVGGTVSHGTAMTIVSKLGEGGAARENGRIIKKPLGQKGMEIQFGSKKIFVMSIPWGDISTAYFTTGIPSIETYTAVKKRVPYNETTTIVQLAAANGVGKKYFSQKINSRPAGPGDEMRNKAKSYIWGNVVNAKGETVSASFSCADGYTLTAYSSLLITKKILEGNFKTGYQTPASCYGENLVKEIPGTEWK